MLKAYEFKVKSCNFVKKMLNFKKVSDADMVHLYVKDVLRECDGTLFCGDESLELKSFSKDTRTIQPNDVYLGIQGETFDGNKFYLKALEQGASCCILDSFDPKEFDHHYLDRTIILVKDTVEALQRLATYKRNQVSIPVIAVTGSAGKTSTKDMIADILNQKYCVLKTPGNLNGQIGLPLNILELQDEEVMVLEMGMNDFGQISKLTAIAKPTIGVITNIGTAHIGILGSRENILKSKLEILEGMAPGSSLVINHDNDLLSKLSFQDYKVYGCGINQPSDYVASHLNVLNQLSEFDVSYDNQCYSVSLPAMGNAFIMDSLLAIAVGDLLDLTPSQIRAGLQNFKLNGNRMEFIKVQNGITIINDTYNSNYEALVSAIDTLKQYSGNRKVAVLGDVLELDDFASDIHFQIGEIPSLQSVDAIFLNGEHAKYILDGALNQGISKDQIFYFDNKADMVQMLLQFLQDGDTILIKASHGMRFDEIVDQLKESYRV